MDTPPIKPSVFCRILLIAALVLFGYIVVSAFLASTPPKLLSKEIIITLALIIALVLSESFHFISIGSVLQLKKEVKRADQEKGEAKQELKDLRISYANLAAQIAQSQSQRQSTFNITGISPNDLKQVFGVVDATNEETQKSKEESAPETSSTHETVQPSSQIRPDFQTRRKLSESLENDLFDRFAKKFSISSLDIRRNVTFDVSFQFIDPIMTRPSVYDGYIRNSDKEFLIEAVPYLERLSPTTRDRIFVLLARVLFYRQAKQCDAELVLLVADIPEEERGFSAFRLPESRFFEWFQPAIANKLLRVERFQYSQEEFDAIKAKAQIQT